MPYTLGQFVAMIRKGEFDANLARVRNLIAGSGITLEHSGTHVLKGIAEPCELYRVLAASTVIVEYP